MSLRLLKTFKAMNLTSFNILYFEHQMVIWTVPLDPKCLFWVISIVSSGPESLFYILTLFMK